jgi:hypothetical protein
MVLRLKVVRRDLDSLIDQPFADRLIGVDAILIGLDVDQRVVKVEDQALNSHFL